MATVIISCYSVVTLTRPFPSYRINKLSPPSSTSILSAHTVKWEVGMPTASLTLTEAATHSLILPSPRKWASRGHSPRTLPTQLLPVHGIKQCLGHCPLFALPASASLSLPSLEVLVSLLFLRLGKKFEEAASSTLLEETRAKTQFLPTALSCRTALAPRDCHAGLSGLPAKADPPLSLLAGRRPWKRLQSSHEARRGWLSLNRIPSLGVRNPRRPESRMPA